LIYIGDYEELVPGEGYDSMKAHFEKGAYPGKEKIVKYLTCGKVDMASFQLPKDVFTGERIPMTMLGTNDGVYMWWNTLAYYVDKYNLRLPEEFEKHILK